MKKSNKFLRKLAVITLSCTSLLQFTSVFAGDPESSNVGKSPLSVFKLRNPRGYTVIPGTLTQEPTTSKSPRPTYSQRNEQTDTPKKLAKNTSAGGTVQIRSYRFPARVRDITSFEEFRNVQPTECLNHHRNPAAFGQVNRPKHHISYRNNCGCTTCCVTYSDIGGILGWKLARNAVLAGFKVPPSQRQTDGWDIYANPAPGTDLYKALVTAELWQEEMRLKGLPKELKYADGTEFTEIDKRIFCEVIGKGIPPEWEKKYKK